MSESANTWCKTSLFLAAFLVAGCTFEDGNDKSPSTPISSPDVDGSVLLDQALHNEPIEPAVAEDKAKEPAKDDPLSDQRTGREASPANREADSQPSQEQVAKPSQPPPDVDPTTVYVSSTPHVSKASSASVMAELAASREAMRRRNFQSAHQHLEMAARLRQDLRDVEAYEQLADVYRWWLSAWNHVQQEARAMKMGNRMDTWKGPAIVRRVSKKSIDLQISGAQPRSFAISTDEMPVLLAVGLLDHRATRKGIPLDRELAALLLFDEDGLSHAKEACSRAAQRGLFIAPLAQEIRRIDETQVAEEH